LLYYQKHRKRGKSKLDRLGIPEEELARQQQQLFDEARQQQLEVIVSVVQPILVIWAVVFLFNASCALNFRLSFEFVVSLWC